MKAIAQQLLLLLFINLIRNNVSKIISLYDFLKVYYESE